MVAGETISDNDIIIVGLASLPKEYAVIRTVILARESSITLRKFRAQLLGTEKEIEGEMNLLSQNMATLFVQGSYSGQNTSSGSIMYGHGSSNGASSSNSNQNFVEFQIFSSNTTLSFPLGHQVSEFQYGLKV